MLRVSDGTILEPGDALPPLPDGRMILDVETTSGDPGAAALDPWQGHRVCGVAYALDDDGPAWYMPVRHSRGNNLDLDAVTRWVADAMRRATRWCNHNVKFDAHFVAADGVEPCDEVECTLTQAKLVNSDWEDYSLDALSRRLLGQGKGDDALDQYLRGARSKDFGDLPIDLLGQHGCRDVLLTRALRRRLERDMPAECSDLWEIERRVTLVLYDIERAGMRVDPTELKVAALVLMGRLIRLEERIASTAGFPLNPSSNDDCYAGLCVANGLPVMGRTDAGDPSFDAEALGHYARLPQVVGSPALSTLVESMLRYREQATLLHTFVEPYASLHRNGVLHPTYNQAVRTGRMSCSHPNAQQLSAEAKAYVHPPVGRWFVSHDASQIEFRILVHYMRNEEAIRAYGADPRTDYHEWVARLCGIPRRPAKNVNFAMGYGAGRPRVVSMLSQEPELVSGLLVAVDDAIASGRCDPSRRKEMFDQLCRRRGHEVYRTYHARLPELARLSKEATRNAERRGYVFNGYGRRRYLRRAKSYKALNAVVQSFAADMMKDRVAAIAPRYCREARDLGLTIHAIVHDEVLMSCEPDVARDDRALAWMRDVLEHPSRSLRVPVRWETKRGDATWATLTAT